MPKAVLTNGPILPLEPLPCEWKDGEELRLERSDSGLESEPSDEEVERAFQELAILCEANDPADDDRLERALAGMKREAKLASESVFIRQS